VTRPVLVLCQKATFRLKNINFGPACETYALVTEWSENITFVAKDRVPPSQNIFRLFNLPLFDCLGQSRKTQMCLLTKYLAIVMIRNNGRKSKLVKTNWTWLG
jgi:hypothetical protein